MRCGARRGGSRPAPSHETLRSVTIVFSDLKGSTSLGEQLDSEALREVMTRYFDEMSLALEKHGGTVEKFIGDAIMAVFGMPIAHEDDALRAVRAALEMKERLAVAQRRARAALRRHAREPDRRQHRARSSRRARPPHGSGS